MEMLVLTFPDIDPVAFRIFGFKIHWYALMYLLAFLMAYLLLRRRLHHEPYRSIRTPKPYSPELVEDLVLAGILGVILGGRLGYVLFYKPGYYWEHPADIVKLWDGGMSFHGGAIGVALAVGIYALHQKRPFLQLTDFMLPAVPIGLAAGRVGNFINGELWGRPAPESLPWAMIFPSGGDVPRHPSQLYQALLEGVLLFVLLWWFASRPRYRGEVSAAFLVGYGVFRFIGEYFREPDAFLGYLSLGLSMGQWLSVPMVVGGVALWIWARRARHLDAATTPVEEGADGSDPDAVDATGKDPAAATADEADRVKGDEATAGASPVGRRALIEPEDVHRPEDSAPEPQSPSSVAHPERAE